MRPEKLTEPEIASRLNDVPFWHQESAVITRSFELPTFSAAIAFVVRVGFLAEQVDHHPDIDIRYRHVTIALTTHDAGGLTTLDFTLASQIDAIA